MIRILFLILLFLAVSPAGAQEGRWAVRAGGRTLILLQIERAPDAGGWTGRMSRPDHFTFTAGGGARPFVFSDVSGPTVTRRIIAATDTPRGLELTVEGRSEADPDHFLFRVGDEGDARLFILGIDDTFLSLVRTGAEEMVAEGWTPGRSYAAEIIWPTNAEMSAIFAGAW